MISTTRLALMAGIGAAVPGAHIEDVSGAVEDVASKVVRDRPGRTLVMASELGCTRSAIPNYRTGSRGIRDPARHLHGIEPDVHAGQGGRGDAGRRGTVVTTDHSLAAHFEHTIRRDRKGPGDFDDGMKSVDEPTVR